MFTNSTIRIRVAAAAIGVLALSAALAACGSSDDSSSSDGKGGGALRIGYLGAAPPGFDPHSGATGSFQAIYPAYDTLMHISGDGTVEPWLATEWTFDTPTSLTLTLRDDVQFTDGTPFNAAAVKANLEYARDIEQGTGYQPYLKPITDVTAVDDTHVKITLAAANPGLPIDLTTDAGEMVSPKALADPASLATAPVGTGPYLVDDSATRQGTTLGWKRNPDYWAADEDTFPFDEVVYTFGQDPTAIRNAAQAGDLDLLSLNPGDPVPSGFKTTESTSGSTAGFTGIWLDTTGSNTPALKDVRVRQAINYAIDSKTIAETVYEGKATPTAAVPFTEDSSAYSDDLSDLYAFDPDKAKELLSEAGYPDGFSMKMLSLPIADAFAQAIAGNLRDVGIDVDINSVAGPDLPKELFSGTYDAGLLLQSLTGSPGQDLSGLFSANAFFNVHKADDPDLDKQIADADAGTDADTQTSDYQAAAKTAADLAWFAGTMQLQAITAYKPSVVSVSPPPFGQIYLYHYTG